MVRRKTLQLAVLTLCGCMSFGMAHAQNINTLSAKQQKAGWHLLFNGKNLKGWHSYLEKVPAKDWSVRDGAIVLKKNNHDQLTRFQDLVTNGEFKNFDLELDWKMKPCVDSGIMFYVHESRKYKYTFETGPEMQIADLACTKPDSRVLKERAGDIFDLVPVGVEYVKRAGHWNHYEIISNKGHLKLFLNGHKVIDTHLWDAHWWNLVANSKFSAMPGFATFHEGHIALQGTEGKGQPGVKIWFRNIKIKRL